MDSKQPPPLMTVTFNSNNTDKGGLSKTQRLKQQAMKLLNHLYQTYRLESNIMRRDEMNAIYDADIRHFDYELQYFQVYSVMVDMKWLILRRKFDPHVEFNVDKVSKLLKNMNKDKHGRFGFQNKTYEDQGTPQNKFEPLGKNYNPPSYDFGQSHNNYSAKSRNNFAKAKNYEAYNEKNGTSSNNCGVANAVTSGNFAQNDDQYGGFPTAYTHLAGYRGNTEAGPIKRQRTNGPPTLLPFVSDNDCGCNCHSSFRGLTQKEYDSLGNSNVKEELNFAVHSIQKLINELKEEDGPYYGASNEFRALKAELRREKMIRLDVQKELYTKLVQKACMEVTLKQMEVDLNEKRRQLDEIRSFITHIPGNEREISRASFN